MVVVVGSVAALDSTYCRNCRACWDGRLGCMGRQMTRVSTFARKARELVVKIKGPVRYADLLDLKGLYIALGHKIEELECQSIAATATTPTGKAQA